MTIALAGRGGGAGMAPGERWVPLGDPQTARDVLQAQLPGFADGAAVIEECAIVQIRFRPSATERRRGRPIVGAAYRLAVRDARTGTRGVQLLHVRAFDGQGREKFERARAATLARSRFGPALAYLPALDAVVWGFPNDPRLGHLPEVIESARLRHHLPYERLPAELGSPGDVERVDVEPIR